VRKERLVSQTEQANSNRKKPAVPLPSSFQDTSNGGGAAKAKPALDLDNPTIKVY